MESINHKMKYSRNYIFWTSQCDAVLFKIHLSIKKIVDYSKYDRPRKTYNSIVKNILFFKLAWFFSILLTGVYDI